MLLIRAGFSKGRSLVLAFLAAALTTPAGMFVSYPLISHIDQALLGALLTLSAGSLVYVGASHLLPQAESENRRFSIISLGAGIMVTLVVIFSKH